MPTTTTTQRFAEIPDFDSFIKVQQAEVNKKKEKKRSGLPWFPNFAAVKGAGVGAKICAMLLSRLGPLAFFGLLGALGAGAGLVQQARLRHAKDDYAKKAFSMSLVRDHVIQQNEEMKKGLPPREGARNDTLGFVYRGEGLDNPDAAAAAAAKAAADAAAKADAEKAAQAQKTSAAPAAADPNALAAQLAAQAQGAQGVAGAQAAAASNGAARLGAFGSLKSNAGMGGGIGRGFDAPHLNNSLMGKADKMRGGAEAAVGNSALARGTARNWQAARGVTAGARSAIDSNRLRSMQAMMAANRGGDAQRASAVNTQAWDGAAAPSQSVQSAGASVPGAGPSTSAPDIGSTGGGGAEKGPMDVNGGTDTNTNLATVPDVPPYQETVPYQWAIDLAKMLMYGILALSIAIMIMKSTGWGAAAVGPLMTAVGVMGGLLGAIGIYLLAMQQYAQGTMYTLMGATVAIAALAAPQAVTAVTGNAAWIWGNCAWFALLDVGVAGLGIGLQQGVMDPSNSQASKDAYEKQYGVNPDTNQVDPQNKDAFNQQHGDGAADQWNKTHQKFNYTAG